MPTIVTPDGAIRPGATGSTQGPCGMQVVPTWPISQLAAGIVSANRTRNITPFSLALSLSRHDVAFHFA